MSTKTIAVETSVYERLAALKRESESFTRVIDRLITGRRPATLGALLNDLQKSGLPALTEAEAATMNRVTAANRTEPVGPAVDLS